MSRILITGSADGLGQMAAVLLIKQGHQVVLHARNEKRGEQAMDKVKGAERVLIADLSVIAETINLAKQANTSGSFDAVIHNAAVYKVSEKDITIDGLSPLFAVNSLAPYILTALIQKPERLIYMSSGMHLQGNPNLNGRSADSSRKVRPITYSDTKLHDMILCRAVARRWPDCFANAVNPGWVPTRMGGSGAPDDLEKGFETQAWLAVSHDKEVRVSGKYFFHRKESNHSAKADDDEIQEKFMSVCGEISGVHF